MRNLIIIGMLLAAASMAGWFTVQRDGDTTRININRNEIRQDTDLLIERGREILRQREQQRYASPGNESYDASGQTYPRR